MVPPTILLAGLLLLSSPPVAVAVEVPAYCVEVDPRLFPPAYIYECDLLGDIKMKAETTPAGFVVPVLP